MVASKKAWIPVIDPYKLGLFFRLRALESSTRSSISQKAGSLGGVSNAGFVSLGEESLQQPLSLAHVSEALKRNRSTTLVVQPQHDITVRPYKYNDITDRPHDITARHMTLKFGTRRYGTVWHMR